MAFLLAGKMKDKLAKLLAVILLVGYLDKCKTDKSAESMHKKLQSNDSLDSVEANEPVKRSTNKPLLEVEKITTKENADPAPYTTNDEEFICTNALQVDILNPTQLLVGICRNDVTDATSSSAIGHIAIDDILDPEEIIPPLAGLYGNTSAVGPENGANWDGVGSKADMSFPEEFIQVERVLYFVDVRSCLRKVDRHTEKVTTLLGSCGDSTLNLPGVAALRVYGMAYFEEERTFVFTIAQEGVYVCVEDPPGDFTCRRVIKRAEFNSEIPTDTGRQLIRGVNSDGSQNYYIWHKVRFGMNRYDFSNIIGNDTTTLNYDNLTLAHYASVRVTDEIETTAWYIDRSKEIGTNDAVLQFSKDGKVLLIFDIFNDIMFALDTYPDDGIARIEQTCQRTMGTREDYIDNCTFSDIRAAVWLEDMNKIVISERGPGQVRIVDAYLTHTQETTTIQTSIITNDVHQNTNDSGVTSKQEKSSTRTQEETSEPTKKTSEPTKETSEPTKETSEPSNKTSEPTKDTSEPSKETSEPTKETSEPTKETSEPTKETSEPTKETVRLAKNSAEPTEVTQVRAQSMMSGQHRLPSSTLAAKLERKPDNSNRESTKPTEITQVTAKSINNGGYKISSSAYFWIFNTLFTKNLAQL